MTLLEQLERERQACFESIAPPVHPTNVSQGTVSCLHIMPFEPADLDGLFPGTTETIQLTAGRFRGNGASVGSRDIGILEFSVNCGIQLRTEVSAKRLLVGFARSADGARVIANGRECQDGRLILATGCDLVLSILGAASMLWLDVDLEAITHKYGLRPLPPCAIKAIVEANPAQLAALNAYVSNTFVMAGQGRLDNLRKPLRVERDAVRAIFAMLRRGHNSAETQAEAKRLELVERAERLMWASIEEPPTLHQICVAADCKVRTLIYAFNSTFGLSPMKYFKVQRLNAARRKLRAATEGMRIFDVAADCGFWHMGHFGRDYKSMFGTTPKMGRSRKLFSELRSAHSS